MSELPASGATATDGELLLTVQDAVAIALQRNLGLYVQRYGQAQFDLQIDESMGIYDLNLSGQIRKTEETSPSASDLDGAAVLTRETDNYNAQVSQLTPWGGTATATFNTFRQEDNSTFSSLNPFFFTDLDVTYTQPLLRNFGRDATERGIRIARLNSSMNRESFEQQVNTTIQQVINAYSTLIESREQLTVARESKDLANELHDMNKVRVEVGTLAPLELVQSEVGIATREEEIIRAQQAVGDAEDDLRRLLNLETGQLWNVAIIPEAAEEPERVAIVFEEAIQAAFDHRPELRRQQLELERLGIETSYWANQAKPSLDLSATYGYNGLGGDIIIRDQNGQVLNVISGGFSDAVDQLTEGDFDGWRLQLTFGYPLQNRQAKSRQTRAAIDEEQGRVELDDLTQSIRAEVRKAVRAVRSAEQQIDSAGASVRLAERSLDAERKRYDNGLSTSFQVLEIQEDLSQARSREVSAIATHRRAITEYYRAIGGLLDAANVEWMDGENVE